MLDIPIKQLEKCFNLLNERFYNNQLVNTAIAVQSRGRKKNNYGWITSSEVWTSNKTGEVFYEINICAECLHLEIEIISAIMLHEMAHLYNKQHNIVDTSKDNRYHNKAFKFTAEQRGLIITHSKKFGWSDTVPNDDALDFIENDLKTIDLVYSRYVNDEQAQADDKAKQKNKEQGYVKYICPQCLIIARAKKDISLICGKCKVELIVDNNKKEEKQEKQEKSSEDTGL